MKLWYYNRGAMFVLDTNTKLLTSKYKNPESSKKYYRI